MSAKLTDCLPAMSLFTSDIRMVEPLLTPSDSFYQKLKFYSTKCALPYALLTLDSKDRSGPAPLRSDASRAHLKKSSSRLLILLLLLLSGNVNINPGPECFSASLQHLPTPNEWS